ncbi:hypothetical protein QBC33DRAFT_545600 [Phialemonium atrogriseum]|uniref:Uncharacterized protein n=1 Tax=Phialemonium atrogriseum TaxID=1093897 RepID=A0AAJ0BX60_9PEZI|nr:uncharacterized protein QBC33DRAFT_545600 [Phialemonium atrogriseum]KAK1765048.1 hypothetical protein QBC33DRAFT_545600 [Phialemonium atrogriseum]
MIWNKRWGILPGMSWKHEQPLNDFLRQEMGDDAVPTQANTPDGTIHGAQEEQPYISIFGLPPAAESNGPAPRDPNRSQEEEQQQQQLAVLDPTEPLDDDGDHSSVPGHRLTGSRRGPSSSPPSPRRTRRGSSPGHEQAPRAAHGALGPVRPSRVSKPHKGPGSGSGARLRRPKHPKSPPGAQKQQQSSSPGPAVAETAPTPPPQEVAPVVTQRRSERLRQAANAGAGSSPPRGTTTPRKSTKKGRPATTRRQKG